MKKREEKQTGTLPPPPPPPPYVCYTIMDIFFVHACSTGLVYCSFYVGARPWYKDSKIVYSIFPLVLMPSFLSEGDS